MRKWTQDYKEMLEEWVVGTEKVNSTLKVNESRRFSTLRPSDANSAFIQDYKEYHTDTSVHFVITMTEAEMRKAEEEGLEKRFRMTSTISIANMVCFDLNGKIRKYTSPEEILEDFYHKRLEYYGIRKASRLGCRAWGYLWLITGITYSKTSQMNSPGSLIGFPIKLDSSR